MRRRMFAWIALAAIVVVGNTGLLLRLRGRPRTGTAPRPGEASMPLRETRAVPRAPTAEEERLLAAAGDAGGTGGPRLRVSVADAGGSPVAAATVRAEPDSRASLSPFREPPLAEGTTGSDGRCDLAPARRVRTRVVVEKGGFARAEASVDGPEVRVVLERAGLIRGRVVEDGSGAPLPGVAVRARRDPARPVDARTPEDGTFVLGGLRPGAWRVEASTDIHPPVTVTAEVGAGGEASVEVRLKRGFTIRGRVVYQGSDREVGEGTVSWREERRGTPVDGSTERSAAIGPGGRFLLGGLPGPVQDFRVVAGGNLHRVRGQRCVLDPKTGEQVGEIQVALPANNPPGLDFRGVVRDEEGRPVGGARVIAGWAVLVALSLNDLGLEQDRLSEARTDAEGAFRIMPGRGWRHEAGDSGATVLALHPDFAPALVLLPYRSRDRRIDLVLRKGASVLVSVRDEAGHAAADVEVYTKMIHSDLKEGRSEEGDVAESLRAHPVTDAGGHAVLAHMGPGSWFVLARALDSAEGVCAALDVPEGAKDMALDLTVRRLPSATGRVVDSSGDPVAGVFVISRVGAEETLMAWTGADGRFTFPAVLLTPTFGGQGGISVSVQGRRIAVPGGDAFVPFGVETDVVVAPR